MNTNTDRQAQGERQELQWGESLQFHGLWARVWVNRESNCSVLSRGLTWHDLIHISIGSLGQMCWDCPEKNRGEKESPWGSHCCGNLRVSGDMARAVAVEAVSKRRDPKGNRKRTWGGADALSVVCARGELRMTVRNRHLPHGDGSKWVRTGRVSEVSQWRCCLRHPVGSSEVKYTNAWDGSWRVLSKQKAMQAVRL